MTTTECALSGITLDDGDPLHRSTVRLYEGKELVVCRAVAHFIDRPGTRPRHMRAFVETLVAREDRERELSKGRAA